jgi:putative transposase
MPNHVHLILVPNEPDGLARALGEAHRRYSTAVNRREGWTGYLWQGRFASCALDEPHLLAAARHIELNPVRAGLVARPADWPWSSAAAHLTRAPDGLTSIEPLLERVGAWRTWLDLPPDPDEEDRLRLHLRTGRPLGDPAFVAELERRLGRPLLPRKRGRKPRTEHDSARGAQNEPERPVLSASS